MSPPPDPSLVPAPAARSGLGSGNSHGTRLVNGTALLVLLYFGREILLPITLAAILSLLIAPLVRVIRRTGMGQVPAVLAAVIALTVALMGLGLVIGTQVVAMASSLPQYQSTIRAKLHVVREITVGRMEAVQGRAGRMMSQLADLPDDDASAAGLQGAPRQAIPIVNGVVPVEVHERPATPVQLMRRVFSTVWGPLGTASIVLIVLLFVLLEHESLRDRFIRLTGGSDLRRTTQAFNDAGERLSRFFVSQFAVNVGVGAAVGIGLTLIGLPHGMLWAVLTALLRFVPYVGVGLAAVSAALLGAAVDPGWSLMFETIGLFAVVELLATQAVEPQLYGHSTGLSPLSVVVAAIFWSWIWGPVGLLVSTPLTLCLVVAGRHVKALAFLNILLGDTPALTMSQRFYQRALSGDADEIIGDARKFLKRKSFARYCDAILMPALKLASADLADGSIRPEQQVKVKGAIVQVIEALGPDERRKSCWHRRPSVLDDASLGLQLRHRREEEFGLYQGPVNVPPGSVTLCVGLGTMRDDLVTELLVRILRDLDVDARHLSIEDMERPKPPGATVDGVARVFLVTAVAAQEWGMGVALAAEIRRRWPQATLIGMMPTDMLTESERRLVEGSVDLLANTFEEAVAHAGIRAPSRPGKPAEAAPASSSTAVSNR